MLATIVEEDVVDGGGRAGSGAGAGDDAAAADEAAAAGGSGEGGGAGGRRRRPPRGRSAAAAAAAADDKEEFDSITIWTKRGHDEAAQIGIAHAARGLLQLPLTVGMTYELHPHHDDVRASPGRRDKRAIYRA